MNFRTLGIGLAITAALAAIGAAALDRFMPGRSTSYEGYNQARVDEFRKGEEPVLFRYIRNCEKPGADAIVDQIWEKEDDFGRPRQLAYYTRMSDPKAGTSRESGIPGWRGLLTPIMLPAASDTPPGEFSVCDFANTSEREILYPAALENADRETVVPTTADSIAWEARATSDAQVLSLAKLWEQARAELRGRGPAWQESVERRLRPDGKETLEAASVRYRGTDGSEVTLQFRKIEGNPSVLAVLIAHRRLPKEPKVTHDEFGVPLAPAAEAAPAAAPQAPASAAQ